MAHWAGGRGRNSAVLDANNDGYPDLFSSTAALRSDGLLSPNRPYLNTGRGSMLDSPSMGLDLDIGSRCAHAVDYNSDGWPDLLVCGDIGGVHLFKNNQGRSFTDVSAILGAQVSATDAAMADVNHDGRADLITLTSAAVAERLQRADALSIANDTMYGLGAGVWTRDGSRAYRMGRAIKAGPASSSLELMTCCRGGRGLPVLHQFRARHRVAEAGSGPRRRGR